MNVLCDVESDGDEGLFGLREVGEVDGEEAIAAFSVSEGEGEGGDIDQGGVHMMAAAKAIRPGPAYWWGRLEAQEEYTKIMIDSGNTVSDLVSEEFADQLGLEGEVMSGQIEVPTATATTLRVFRKCLEVKVKLAGIAGKFTLRLLVVKGLTHPVNLGQHFLGRYWCSLEFAGGRTQLCIRGQSVQLASRGETQPAWARKEAQREEGITRPPETQRPPQWAAPPAADSQLARRRGWELCTLEAMLTGSGGSDVWVMDWAPLAAWELPPPASAGVARGDRGSIGRSRPE